jgi:outer membrane protein OmpA-like peptidoglycan-associated protein
MKMKVLLTIFLTCFVANAYSQGARSYNPDELNLRKSKTLYDQGNYAEAIPFLKQLVNSGNQNPQILYYLASSYAYSLDYENAIASYEKLFLTDPGYEVIAYYECGYAYSQKKEFDKASEKYQQFLNKNPGTASFQSFIHKAKYKLSYAQQRAQLQSVVTMKLPVKLAEPINTKYSDYLPMLDPTGRKLYFTSRRKGGISVELADDEDFDEDLYAIEKNNGIWGSPVLMPEPVNSENNDGAASFSADGQTMIYGACNRNDGVGECDLYISYLDGKEWSNPLNMGNVVNSTDWDAHSTISFDGQKIIFASDRAGGYGSTDLYSVEKNIFGDWGVPVNLGSIVNTPFDEAAPFLSQDGKTLYFASFGHPGYGGFDIFKSVLEQGKWSTPLNLGKPINTEGDDKFFSIGGSGEYGYFSSTRGGDLDLFEIEIPEEMRPQPTVVVSGTVTDANTTKPLGAYVLVENLNTGELIAMNKSNSVSGKYLVVLPAGVSYSVSANKEGFFFFSNRFDVPLTSKYEEIRKDISLKPIEKGMKVVLNNIFFETGKSTLSPQSQVELSKAIDLMNKNPSMVIEVGGHTDNLGDDAMNMKLSHERAKAVSDYLVANGIKNIRVQAKGYGELNPVASNDFEDGRRSNRRTEFIILQF